jgi:transcriptional regulator with XRE-family HTH domain
MAAETDDVYVLETDSTAESVETEQSEQEVLAELGRRLVRLREARGWTRTELARRLGMSRERLAHWERGEHHPQLDALLALRRVLETSIDELVTGEPAPRTGLSREKRDQGISHLAGLMKLFRC